MSKVRLDAVMALATIALSAPAAGAPLSRCDAARTPALLVRVDGFKARTGTVRVQTYGGDPRHYFDKASYLKRVDAAVPPAGPLEICMTVPAPGRYAVSVRHDVDGSGHTGRGDGGGMSGNPHMSLLDVLLRRKPDPALVAVEVERGVRVVPVTLNYLFGASFRPVTG